MERSSHFFVILKPEDECQTTKSHCSSLETIDVAESNTQYASDDGVLFDKEKQTLIRFPCNKGKHYSIPDGVRTVNDYAFEGSERLENITISSSVRNIGERSFKACSNLQFIGVDGGQNFKSVVIQQTTEQIDFNVQ